MFELFNETCGLIFFIKAHKSFLKAWNFNLICCCFFVRLMCQSSLNSNFATYFLLMLRTVVRPEDTKYSLQLLTTSVQWKSFSTAKENFSILWIWGRKSSVTIGIVSKFNGCCLCPIKLCCNTGWTRYKLNPSFATGIQHLCDNKSLIGLHPP